MTLKLKLHRFEKSEETQRDRMRFPVHAVREWPGPHRSNLGGGRLIVGAAGSEDGALRHPELVRHIEATLDRLQAGVDSLKEQVENYKFPGVRDGIRPRAA